MSSIDKAATSFIHDLDALREILPPVMAMAITIRRDAAKRHLDYLEEHGTFVREEEEDGAKNKVFHLDASQTREISRIEKQHLRSKTATTLLPRTFLVSFVSVYDAFLGRLITALLQEKPEVLNSSARQLTYKELKDFTDLDSARTHILEQEVESVLRESHFEQFKWLERTFDVKLRDGLSAWPIFIELTERRNLFVHCHGKVSSQYLRCCSDHKALPTGIGLGDTLEADNKYLVTAYKCLYEIGTKLSQVLWRKTKPDQLVQADEALNKICYELLVEEKYDLATRLLEFGVKTLPKHGSEVTKRIFVINLAQAYKFSGKAQECLDELSKMDWSACAEHFNLCVAVLKDDYALASQVMRSIGDSGSLSKQEYIDWPVFRKFRESDEFKEAFLEIFKEKPQTVQTVSEPPQPPTEDGPES